MIILEDTLVSDDILQQNFVCNLQKCKGICCVEGDSGAPLEDFEIEQINENLDTIKPYMRKDLLDQVNKEGFYEKDADGDLVTKCKNGRECVFAITENGIYKCSIEKAYNDGKSNFKKPVSCHLYPIRISQVGNYTALNYSRWEICTPACTLGNSLQMPIYKFLENALVSRFGQKWFDSLDEIASAMKTNQL